MKRMCNWIGLWIWAIALWETIASYYKDKEFKNKLDSAKWFNKCKIIFKNIIDINTSFYTDVNTIDYSQKIDQYKKILNKRIDDLNERINYLKNEWEKLNQDKVQPLIKDIQDKYNEIANIVWEQKDELLNKYWSTIEELQKKVTDTVENIKWKIDNNFGKTNK